MTVRDLKVAGTTVAVLVFLFVVSIGCYVAVSRVNGFEARYGEVLTILDANLQRAKQQQLEAEQARTATPPPQGQPPQGPPNNGG